MSGQQPMLCTAWSRSASILQGGLGGMPQYPLHKESFTVSVICVVSSELRAGGTALGLRVTCVTVVFSKQYVSGAWQEFTNSKLTRRSLSRP